MSTQEATNKSLTEQDGQQQSRPIPALNNGFQLGELSQTLAVFGPVLYVVLALAEASSYVARPITIILYIGLLLFGLLFIAMGNIPSTTPSQDAGDEMEFAFTLVGAIAVLVSFSQLARHLTILQGGFAFDELGYWHWLRFGLSNLLEAALFDTPAIYEWNLSEIRPISNWSRTLVFLFRTTIELVVVAAVLRQVAIARKTRHQLPKNQATSYFGMVLPTLGSLLLIAWWGLPLAVGIGAVVNDGLSFAATWSTIKTGTPVVLGFLLAWHGLRGLFGLSSRWNKLWSLVGLGVGIWMVRESWPMLRTFLGL